MRVNDMQFCIDLLTILDNYRNDKVNYPWDAKSTQERANEKLFISYLNTIAKINTLPKYASKFQDVELSEWMIPSIFTPLIMPAEVTVDGSAEAVNLIDVNKEHQIGDENGKVVILGYTQFMNVNHALRRIFRKDESSWFHKVSDLRDSILLTDALKRAAYNDVTPNYLCMPIALRIQFYQSECFVYDTHSVARRFMEQHISKEV